MSSSAQTAIRRDSVEELFKGASNGVERLPMLRVAFERTAGAFAEDFRGFAGKPPQLSMQSLQAGTAADMVGQSDGTSVIGVLHAEKWGARFLVCAHREAVFAFVEMMLGSEGAEPPFAEQRPFSRIEMRLAGRLFERIATALAASFAPIAETPFILEETSDRIDLDVIGGRHSPVVAATFRFDAIERGGQVLIAIPQAALNPMRQAFSRLASKAPAARDPRWSQQIKSEVTRANVALSAVLDERPALLEEISNLKPGQIMHLNATPQSLVYVECNGERMLQCHLGQSNGVYMLRVDGFVDQEQAFMNDILSG